MDARQPLEANFNGKMLKNDKDNKSGGHRKKVGLCNEGEKLKESDELG